MTLGARPICAAASCAGDAEHQSLCSNPDPVGTPLNPTGRLVACWRRILRDGGADAGELRQRPRAAGERVQRLTRRPGRRTVGGPETGQPQQAAAAPTNPYDMNQAYLDALSNPGHVTTPGATVPQSAPPSNQSGVLQQFLANWNKGGGQTKGAGNYDNSGFFKALQGQV